MIEYIRGEVAELTPTLAVIDCQGVGYGLNISLTTYSTLAIGREARLYVYEAIREDAHLLYGFIDRRERELFLLLISVSGVGPNTARMILSSLSPAELEQVIVAGQVNMLKSVKGIGAKTAERIIVDLKDKIKGGSDTLLISHTTQQQELQDEAVAALVMLGFPQAASQKVVPKAGKRKPDTESRKSDKNGIENAVITYIDGRVKINRFARRRPSDDEKETLCDIYSFGYKRNKHLFRFCCISGCKRLAHRSSRRHDSPYPDTFSRSENYDRDFRRPA